MIASIDSGIAVASIPIDLQTTHFFNPTTEDRI